MFFHNESVRGIKRWYPCLQGSATGWRSCSVSGSAGQAGLALWEDPPPPPASQTPPPPETQSRGWGVIYGEWWTDALSTAFSPLDNSDRNVFHHGKGKWCHKPLSWRQKHWDIQTWSEEKGFFLCKILYFYNQCIAPSIKGLLHNVHYEHGKTEWCQNRVIVPLLFRK